MLLCSGTCMCVILCLDVDFGVVDAKAFRCGQSEHTLCDLLMCVDAGM